MNIYEKIKSMNIEELTDWIDKYGQFDDSPWMKWFDKTYCKNCESIKCRSKQYNTETSYAYCELHDNCKFFPDIEYVPDNRDIIRIWLETETDKTDTWECDTCDYTVGDPYGHYCYTDLIGGVHSDGLGWNPNGVFCGECSYSTCENCKHREVKENGQ